MAAPVNHGAGITGYKIAPGTNSWLPNGGIISQGFGVLEQIIQFGINAPHEGIDIAGKRGDPVTLPANQNATVLGTGWDSYGGGNFVKLLLGDGSQVELFHLQDSLVHTGQHLTGSTLLGHMDSTGNSTGDHLHFQINQNGKPVDPWTWLMDTAAGAPAPTASKGGSGNPITDALGLGNVNDFFGHLITPGHDPCSPPSDEMGLFKVIDAATCPQNWWKLLFVSTGVVLIIGGVIIYFFTQEKQAVVQVVHETEEVAPMVAAA